MMLTTLRVRYLGVKISCVTPTLGEPHISVSLLYCVYSVFYFRICFILLLCDPIFPTERKKNKSLKVELKMKEGY
jgi:hypothetical protein